MLIRPLAPEDRPAIAAMLARVSSFDSSDVDLALELIDTYLKHPQQKDYLVVCAVESNSVEGYACYGPTPLSDGTYDLYWIVVDPERTGRGLGSALLAAIERDLREKGARMLLIETSSDKKYASTRAFYERRGYREEERIRDFYRDGEDRVTYIKRLRAAFLKE